MRSDEASDVSASVIGARRYLTLESAQTLGFTDRARLLFEVAELMQLEFETLWKLEAEDTLKCEHMARGDIEGAIALWRSAAAHCHTFAGRNFSGQARLVSGYEAFSPVGVVGLILPWNFPSIVLSERLPYALAAGCSVLVKPSEIAIGAVARIIEIVQRVWGSSEVATLVSGDGPTTGKQLCEDPGVDMISFTGGTSTGRKIMEVCGPLLKKTSLELGGKNSVIVNSDANLQKAASSIAHATLINGGQACVQGSRVLVHQLVYEEFLDYLSQAYCEHLSSHFETCGVAVQALISPAHAQRVQSHINGAFERGLERMDTFTSRGAMWSEPPFVFLDVPESDPLFLEEVFGPVIAMSTFSTLDQAIAMANVGHYGLAAYVWSESREDSELLIHNVRAGRKWLNCDVRTGLTQLSIGGVSDSGSGREIGWDGIRNYSNQSAITMGN